VTVTKTSTQKDIDKTMYNTSQHCSQLEMCMGMGKTGIPWEWECDKPWGGNGNGNKTHGNGN